MIMSHESSAQRGLLLVISGPSGSGKTTIARAVEQQRDGRFSISATTRPPSPTETGGCDYHFVDEPGFKALVAAGALLEHAHVFGRYWYGTPREPVQQHLAEGRLVILDIDVQGALQVRQSMPNALLVFVLPPHDDELLRRLRARGRDDEPAIQRRFAEACREIEVARTSGAFDAFIVNDELEQAIKETCRLVDRRRSGERG
jgi:guanylate kinase